MERNRAWRRWQRERMKLKRKDYYTIMVWRPHEPIDEQEYKKRLGSAVKTPCPCSCPLCGNPRRHFGEVTLQERRATQ